ncbi:hypothetical protein PT974_01252 [Cladobotryum mycophilum]|uniref:Uncharacterized protein n=1 Tax=Cladobotryum mycophilum TaxID=491253 RepID=A0ABR0T354_9HYPO
MRCNDCNRNFRGSGVICGCWDFGLGVDGEFVEENAWDITLSGRRSRNTTNNKKKKKKHTRHTRRSPPSRNPGRARQIHCEHH